MVFTRVDVTSLYTEDLYFFIWNGMLLKDTKSAASARGRKNESQSPKPFSTWNIPRFTNWEASEIAHVNLLFSSPKCFIPILGG